MFLTVLENPNPSVVAGAVPLRPTEVMVMAAGVFPSDLQNPKLYVGCHGAGMEWSVELLTQRRGFGFGCSEWRWFCLWLVRTW